MNFLLLYLLLLKSTLSAFSGLAALPVLREDFVVKHKLITDRQLNTAIVVGRTTPGPKGLYIVSVGYYAGGTPGAIAAWLALITPALLVIPAVRYASRRATSPRLKRVLDAVVLASAGVSLSATLPLASDALINPLTYALAAGSLAVLLFTKLDSLVVIALSALATVIAALIR